LPEKVKIVPLKVGDPRENMDEDLRLLHLREKGEIPSTLRLYGWSRLSLSYGWNQKPPPCKRIPAVKRPTGGGILLHLWDISFALVGSREAWGPGPRDIYLKVANLIKDVFQDFGVDVRVDEGPLTSAGSELCWWFRSFGELSWRGKKVVAVAMRTARRSFLVHGSFYPTIDHSLASEILGVGKDSLERRVATLEEMGIDEGEFLVKFTQAFRGK
jgi:lipoate-protein ligase A